MIFLQALFFRPLAPEHVAPEIPLTKGSAESVMRNDRLGPALPTDQVLEEFAHVQKK